MIKIIYETRKEFIDLKNCLVNSYGQHPCPFESDYNIKCAAANFDCEECVYKNIIWEERRIINEN